MTSNLTAAFLETQTKDGWWPYLPGHGESVEATAWCAIACKKNEKLARAALKHLTEIQNSDGGWSTAADTGASDWSTAAALLALNVLKKHTKAIDPSLTTGIERAVSRGCKLLVSLRTDIITDLTRVGLMVMQGPEFDYPRGWPWEPNTYHWVEPTSYAILAIKSSPYAADKRYKQIVSQAQQYLLEKTCSAGGWNFGSPRTLGTDWPPLPSPTAFALLAMQDQSGPKIDQALTYLRTASGPPIDSTIADSLALIARNLHGDDVSKQVAPIKERFSKLDQQSVNLCSIAAGTIAINLATDGNPFKFTAS